MKYVTLFLAFLLNFSTQHAFSSRSTITEEEERTPTKTHPLPQETSEESSSEKKKPISPSYIFTGGCFSLYDGAAPPDEKNPKAPQLAESSEQEAPYILPYGCFSLNH